MQPIASKATNLLRIIVWMPPSFFLEPFKAIKIALNACSSASTLIKIPNITHRALTPPSNTLLVEKEWRRHNVLLHGPMPTSTLLVISRNQNVAIALRKRNLLAFCHLLFQSCNQTLYWALPFDQATMSNWKGNCFWIGAFDLDFRNQIKASSSASSRCRSACRTRASGTWTWEPTRPRPTNTKGKAKQHNNAGKHRPRQQAKVDLSCSTILLGMVIMGYCNTCKKRLCNETTNSHAETKAPQTNDQQNNTAQRNQAPLKLQHNGCGTYKHSPRTAHHRKCQCPRMHEPTKILQNVCQTDGQHNRKALTDINGTPCKLWYRTKNTSATATWAKRPACIIVEM